MWLEYFCNAKGQREIKITLAFLASHEACRRMAVYAMQAAGSRTRPASREARRRAAVKPRPTGFPRAAPRPSGAVWGAGYRPARPASREARRRAAVASRPTGMSSTPLRACGAQSGVQGYYPCYSSTSTKKGWPQCSHTGLSSKSMSEARTITVWPQLGQSKDSS